LPRCADFETYTSKLLSRLLTHILEFLPRLPAKIVQILAHILELLPYFAEILARLFAEITQVLAQVLHIFAQKRNHQWILFWSRCGLFRFVHN